MLIVDDNPTNRRLIGYVMAASGYEVDTAEDADHALARIAARPPRLILMDVEMPGIDGLELTRRLKANPATRGIVIVVVTALATADVRARAAAAGCDDYVTKPIDPRALPATVARLLEPALV